MKKKFILSLLIIFGIFNATSTNQVAIVSVPKSGTYLLLKLLRLLTGNNKPQVEPKGWTLINDAVMDTFFRNQKFLVAHALHTPDNIQQLQRKNIKTFFIYRHPCAQIVSAAFYIKQPNSSWKTHSKWELDDLIYELITNSGSVWNAVYYGNEIWQKTPDIRSFYDLYLPWRHEPNVYTTTFEKLVGPQGGGTLEAQIHEIIAIANHIDIQIDYEQALEISNKLFGETITFRDGKIDSWKEYFSERHKEAFKNVAGSLLQDLHYEEL